MLPRTLRPYIFLALAVLGYSLEPIALKVVVKTMPIMQINFWLSLFATLGMGAIILFERRQSTLFSYSKNDLLKIFAIGAIGMVIFNILVAYGYTPLPVAQANSLKYIWPVILALIAIPIMREKFSQIKLAGAVLGFIGVFVLLNGGFTLNLPTDHVDAVAAVLIASLCWAIFNILQKQQNYEPFTSVFLMSLFALPIFAVLMLLGGQLRLPNITELFALAYLGAIAFGAALAFYFKALQFGDTSRIAALSYTTPFLTLFWAALLLKETIYWFYPLGLGLVVCGALVQMRFAKQAGSQLVRDTRIPDNRFSDLTPVFSGTRSLPVYSAMKGGGSVLAMRMPKSAPISLNAPKMPSSSLLFTEKRPVDGVSDEEIHASREALGAGSEDTIIFAVGDSTSALDALAAVSKLQTKMRK